MNKAISILKGEHRSISAVVSGLKDLARMAHDASGRPDFTVFRAMLRYIDEYPERLHHPKEDQYLFARLLARYPGAKPLVEDLEREHVEGAKRVRELERSLLFLEDRWPVGAREFRDAVDAYAQFHWNHMRKEEEQILPLAEAHLTETDWRVIEDAFAGNADPIADLREKDFQVLFSRIASIAPAPVGLGEPWRR
jgi:branched-chain amino acid transport system ATP-binding protein